MIRWLTSIVCRLSGCPSEQRRARLRALAHHVGREQPEGASDDDCMHAVLGAYRELEDRTWLAEKRADDLEQAWRDLLSMLLGAQVPDSMPVEPGAICRHLVRARRAGGSNSA